MCNTSYAPYVLCARVLFFVVVTTSLAVIGIFGLFRAVVFFPPSLHYISQFTTSQTLTHRRVRLR